MVSFSSILGRFSTVSYQAVCMLITTVLIFAFLYRPLMTFRPLEIPTELLPVTPEVIKKWGKQPTVVKTGFTITDILRFDILKNDILLTGIVWFEFDPKKVTLESIEKFSFIKVSTEHKYGDYYMLDDKVTMRAFYYVTLEVRETFDYHRFPLDSHLITFRLVNEDRGPDELIFQSNIDSFVFSQNILLPGWHLFEYNVVTGFKNWPFSKTIEDNSEEQAVAYFELGMSKRDMRQVLIIVLPLLIIFFLGLFSLSLSDFDKAMTLGITSVSGLVAFTFVLQSISPDVSYFMISDYFLLILFFCSIIIFTFNFLVSSASQETIETSKAIKGGLVLGLHIFILSAWLYLTNFYYF